MAILVYDVTEIAMTRKMLDRAQTELLQLSRTDRLTNLWARGYWEERFNEEFRRTQRTNETMSLVMFDIDHFKRINDTYGHQVGDEAIRLVASTLRLQSREVDICGRYGGEEFVVILPHTDRDGALVYCERLRSAIMNQTIKIGAEEARFTISLGVSCWSANCESAHVWLQQADQALYKAKNNGRNNTQIFE